MELSGEGNTGTESLMTGPLPALTNDKNHSVRNFLS